MEFSKLYSKYGGMRQPSFALTVNGRSLHSCDDARLDVLECELTCRRRAGALLVEAAVDPKGEHGAVWLDAFQPGAACSLSLGYRQANRPVFTGIVYEAAWEDPLRDGAMRLEAVCLDARGQLMLSSGADAGPVRSMSQLVRSILGGSACAKLTRNIGAFPEDWDLPARRAGQTDFDLLCDAAEFACFEFYVFASELYFGPARPSKEVSVAFSGADGLLSLRRSRSLAGQCASVTVTGADDSGARISFRKKRAADSGFAAGKIAGALSGTLYQPEPAVHTMAQARYLSQARMEARERSGSILSGSCVGLPELRPGRLLSLSGLSEPVNGSYYVHTVCHSLNTAGFETSFEAEGS